MTETLEKPRINPIAIWAPVAFLMLVAAFVLWVAWPAQAVPLPAGETKVQVYLIDDGLTTPAATGEQDGWFARFSMPCGTDGWYVESAGTAICATLDGPHDTVTVLADGDRIVVPADAQKSIARSAAGADGVTRALLVYDGEPAAILRLADPGTATPAS